MPLAGRFVWSVMPKLTEEEVRGKSVLVLLWLNSKCSVAVGRRLQVAMLLMYLCRDHTAKPLSSVPTCISQKSNTMVPQPRGNCTILTLLTDFPDLPILHNIPAVHSLTHNLWDRHCQQPRMTS